MKLHTLLFSAAILAASPAFAQEAMQPTTQGAGAAAEMNVTDPAEFAAMAASSNMFEIQSSELAAGTAQNEAVIAFAQRMIEDHSMAGDEMMAAAQADNITVPTELNEKHQGMLDQLSGLSGQEFEQAYLTAQLQAHQEAVALFQSFSENGPESGLRDFAAETLPTLQEHLEEVQQLAGQ